MTAADLTDTVLEQLNASKKMPGVTADDVYLSAKIPFAFDYAGKDAQVAPGSKWDAANLEHGTMWPASPPLCRGRRGRRHLLRCGSRRSGHPHEGL